jgi:hypothetical protein
MWSSFGSDGEPDQEFLRRMSPPENELPVALPLNVVLANTGDAAAGLNGLQVYTTGLSFELVVRMRPSARESLGRTVDEVVWGHGSGVGQLLLGVEFADGRRVSSLPVRERDGDVVLHPGGGSGSQTSVEQTWWLSPLPPEGPLRIVVRCDALGIEETATELDGAAVRRAVRDVVVLWPWEPSLEGGPPEPPRPPELPSGSWFAGP